MANNIPVVRQIDKQFLSCGICLGRYISPKVLPCLHTFCEQCLATYIPAESLSATCPICRQQSILPIEGVSGLQTNFFIVNLIDVLGEHKICSCCESGRVQASLKCVECEEYLCENCVEPHKQMAEAPNNHHVVSLSELALTESDHEPKLVCPNHDGKSFQFYCEPCETAVCEDCTALEHIEHRTILLKDAMQEQRAALLSLISDARSQVPAIKESLEQVNEVSTMLTKRFKDAEGRICDAFQTLSKMMAERKALLLSELESVYNMKQQTLRDQRESLEGILSKINSSSEFTEETLEHGTDTEILLVRKEMAEKLQELGALQVQFQPEENSSIWFDNTSLHTAKKCVYNLGHVQSNSAVAFETTATGDGLKTCYIGRPTVISITTKDRKGELVKVGEAAITAILTASNGDLIEPYLSDNKNGTYDLTYVVKTEGTYQLEINLYDQEIKGSPFCIKACVGGEELDQLGSSKPLKTVAVKQKGTKRPSSSRSHGSNRRSNPIEDDLNMKLGQKGRNKGEFTNPQGCCVTSNGKVLVADSNNQCVQVFSLNGECKLRFGSPGRVAGKMQRPTGVALTINGNYLVADYDNKWVSVFSPEGKYINKIGTGKLLGPKGIAVDKDGHIIVVDNKASSIFIFQSNGKLIQKFGSRGNNEHQFAGPHYVAVNSKNDIIVSDFHNHCIKVFNHEGNYMFSFGSNGEGNGQFNAPTGVAVDNYDNVLVADWGNSRIQVNNETYAVMNKWIVSPGLSVLAIIVILEDIIRMLTVHSVILSCFQLHLGIRQALIAKVARSYQFAFSSVAALGQEISHI